MGARRREMSLAMSQRSGCGSVMMARSLKRLKRKGSTAPGASGPPRLKRTTAVLAMPHQRHELGDMLGRRLRHDAVPEIEDEGSLPQPRPDRRHRLAHRSAAGDEQERIEIALDR